MNELDRAIKLSERHRREIEDIFVPAQTGGVGGNVRAPTRLDRLAAPKRCVADRSKVWFVIATVIPRDDHRSALCLQKYHMERFREDLPSEDLCRQTRPVTEFRDETINDNVTSINASVIARFWFTHSHFSSKVPMVPGKQKHCTVSQGHYSIACWI